MDKSIGKIDTIPLHAFSESPLPSHGVPSTESRESAPRASEGNVREVAQALFAGKAVEFTRGKGVSTEPEISASEEKKVAHIEQGLFSSIEDLDKELSVQTQKAMLHTQYLNSKADPSDPHRRVEVVSRYSDTPCPRKTAVMVREGTFLHANFVSDTECKRSFVASQYPTDLPLFWSFIVGNPHDIFDLSNESCTYAPTDFGVTKKIDHIHIQLIDKTEIDSNVCIYQYEIRDTTTNTVRFCRRMHFKEWPIHGALSAQVLGTLVDHLETTLSEQTIVHCSGGLGRTGTLIAGFYLKSRILQGKITASNLESSLIELVVHLRQQRGFYVVQNQQQLRLLLLFAQDLLRHMPKSDGRAESTKPLPITDDKQSPDVPHGHHEYSLTDDDVSFLVARIFDAEGRQEVLGEIREELAPKGILTPLGDGLRNINSDAFEIVFGKSVFVPELPERKRKEADAYTFEKEFIEDVQRSLEEIKGHQKFGPIPVGEEHSLGFEGIRKAVERIWIRTHKSRDAASSVLQNVFEMLRDRFGDDVKKVRLFTLIGQKLSDLVEEGLSEPEPKFLGRT